MYPNLWISLFRQVSKHHTTSCNTMGPIPRRRIDKTKKCVFFLSKMNWVKIWCKWERPILSTKNIGNDAVEAWSKNVSVPRTKNMLHSICFRVRGARLCSQNSCGVKLSITKLTPSTYPTNLLYNGQQTTYYLYKY